MIQKRFTQKDEDDYEILDRNKHFAYAHSGYQAKKIIQELNELVETNRWLYKENNELKKENEQLKTQLQNTSDQRDEFYRGARENANRVGKLKEENDRLNMELKGTMELLKSYQKTVRHDAKLFADATKKGYLPPLEGWKEL